VIAGTTPPLPASLSPQSRVNSRSKFIAGHDLGHFVDPKRSRRDFSGYGRNVSRHGADSRGRRANSRGTLADSRGTLGDSRPTMADSPPILRNSPRSLADSRGRVLASPHMGTRDAYLAASSPQRGIPSAISVGRFSCTLNRIRRSPSEERWARLYARSFPANSKSMLASSIRQP
jgi:hypothetical protein